MSNGSDADTLRKARRETLLLIETAKATTRSRWAEISLAVRSAERNVIRWRFREIERRLAALEQPPESTYPLLFEALVNFIVASIPIGRIVDGLVNHMARSFKVGKVIIVSYDWRAAAPTASGVDGARLRQIDKLLDPERRRWSIKEIVEYDDALLKLGTMYKPEIAARFRDITKRALDAGTTSVVDQHRMFQTRAEEAAPPAEPTKSGDDAATHFLKFVETWIIYAQEAELFALSLFGVEVQNSEDEAEIRTIHSALAKVFDPVAQADEPPLDLAGFQEFIEVCVWTTTWDFSPRFHPGRGRGRTIMTAQPRLPSFEVAPLGKDFWTWAIQRYHDPFYGTGEQTYAEIGPTYSLAPTDRFSATLELDEYLRDLSRARDVAAAKPSGRGPGFATPGPQGIAPEARLAFHWGNIIGPDLRNLNYEVANQLEALLGPAKHGLTPPAP